MQTKLIPAMTVPMAFALACGSGGAEGQPPYESPYDYNESEHFSSFTYYGTNGAAETERFVACPPDQVLRGLAAAVNDDDVTSLSIFCQAIGADGALSSEQELLSHGNISQELIMHAETGSVIAGVGAIVSDDDLARLVLYECPWDASTRRVSETCGYRSTPRADAKAELMLYARQGGASQRTRVLAAGIGLSASDGNISAIRMLVATLR